MNFAFFFVEQVSAFNSEELITISLWLFLSQFVPTTLTLDSGVTRPPPLLSEADLLSCMDKVSKMYLPTELIKFWGLNLYVGLEFILQLSDEAFIFD